MNFLKDEFIRLPAELGGAIGQVVEDMALGKVRIQFPGEGVRIFMPEYCALTKVEEGEETRAIAERFKEKTRKAGAKARPLSDLIHIFLEEFPDGFEGRKYHEEERVPKVRASELMKSTLGKDQLQTLLTGGRFEEIVRRAQAMLSATHLAQFDVISLRGALKAETSWQPFSESFFEFLFGEEDREASFKKFVACLATLRVAKWPIVTYFPFLAFPEKDLFLKPDATKTVALACGVELNYQTQPNWLTYSSLAKLSEKLTAALKEVGLQAKDMIDVQSFIWSSFQLDKRRYRSSKQVVATEPVSAAPESAA